MLSNDESLTYARGVAAALRVIGPASRQQVHGMLRGLHLSPLDADEVIVLATAVGLLVEDSRDPRFLRVP